MSKSLAISEDLSLPIDAATQTFAFIARKGAGKTYAAGKLSELLMDAGVQCVVLDTVGNWYGLRLAADGKGSGFDIPVLGGIRLWQRKKAEHNPSPVHLIIEESQLIVPQFTRGDDARMVGIYEEIIRLGRPSKEFFE